MANCESKPFMKLQDDNSNAPILNYNMEQENCLPINSFVPIPIDQQLFKPSAQPSNAIDELKNLTDAEIKTAIINDLKKSTSKYFANFSLVHKSSLPVVFYEASDQAQTHHTVMQVMDSGGGVTMTSPATPLSKSEALYNNKKGEWSFALVTKGNTSYANFSNVDVTLDDIVAMKDPSQFLVLMDQSDIMYWRSLEIREVRIIGQKSTISFPQSAVIDFDIQDIIDNIKQGKAPVFRVNASGMVELDYETLYTETTPLDQFIMVQYESMLCSYLGNYGAGKTVNTFSLLPGERTTISVRTYRDSVMSNSLSENILDSMSEASSNSLQRAFENQNGLSTDNSSATSVNSNISLNSHWNRGGGGGVNLLIFSTGSSSSSGGSTGMSFGSSTTAASHTNTISSVVNSGLNQHVSESNKHREININTTTNSTESSGEENSVVRELSNVNLSRTLNFVFRQLHQEHIVIHWLKNIKFVYYNPNTGEKRTVFSHNLLDMLNDVMVDSNAADTAFLNIMTSVGYVFNYEEDPIQFFESRPFNTPANNTSCDGRILNANQDCLWLRVRNLSDSYANITVPGVILGVQTHVLRTPSVIVDSLLGQGEALDCYNMNLQEKEIEAKDAAIQENELRNTLMQTSIATLNAIPDPVQRAEAYKNMFIEPKCCCDHAGL